MSAKDLANALADVIGENDTHQEPKMWLSTGYPPLNKALSGRYDRGYASGRMHELFGPPSSGKTAIATNVMVHAQRAGGIAAFMDHERSFDVRLAQKFGLDTSPGKWVFKTPNTFEQSINTVMRMAQVVREKKLISPDAPIVAIFDSLAQMVPHEKFLAVKDALAKGEDEALNMRLRLALATATSQNFPALAVWCEQYELTAIFLNQVRTKPGVMYGDPTTTPGGNAPEFAMTTRTKLGRSVLVEKDGSSKSKVGQRIGAEVVKNKVSRPFVKIEWDFLFQPDGSGKFDVVGGVVDHLLELEILKKSGNFIEWEGKKFNRGPLVEKIEADGELDKLLALLPK